MACQGSFFKVQKKTPRIDTAQGGRGGGGGEKKGARSSLTLRLKELPCVLLLLIERS